MSLQTCQLATSHSKKMNNSFICLLPVIVSLLSLQL